MILETQILGHCPSAFVRLSNAMNAVRIPCPVLPSGATSVLPTHHRRQSSGFNDKQSAEDVFQFIGKDRQLSNSACDHRHQPLRGGLHQLVSHRRKISNRDFLVEGNSIGRNSPEADRGIASRAVFSSWEFQILVVQYLCGRRGMGTHLIRRL
jgi:hypothetical protein